MHGQTLLLNGTCLCNSVSPTDVLMYTYNIEILQAIFEQATLLTRYPFTFMYAELQLPPLLLLEIRLSCTSTVCTPVCMQSLCLTITSGSLKALFFLVLYAGV